MRTCVRPLNDGLVEERSTGEETPQSGLLLTWRKQPIEVSQPQDAKASDANNFLSGAIL